jgi:hypothetical protein
LADRESGFRFDFGSDVVKKNRRQERWQGDESNQEDKKKRN